MDRRRSVAVAVVLIVSISVFIVFIGLPLTQTSFHYARQYPSSETRRVMVHLYDLDYTSTNVTVSFLDDPTLLYSIDVIQYYPGLYHLVYFYDGAPWDQTLLFVGICGNGNEQVASVAITLGTGTYYALELDGRLNVSVNYDNGAWLRGQEVVVSCGGGRFEFTLGEDVNFTDSGLDVQTGLGTDLFLDIDLPDGMNGKLELPPAVDFAYSEMVGWSLISSGYGIPTIYSTPSIDQPLLYIDPSGYGLVRARLHD